MTAAPQHRLPARWGLIAIALALTAIGAATLVPSRGQAEPSFGCIVCGDRGVADAIVNAILFTPLGVGMALAGLRFRRAAPLGALVSALVELAQLLVIPGRDPSVGDLLFNTIGTAIGYGVTLLVPAVARLDDRMAARLSIAAALDLALAVVLTGWLLQPSLPAGAYWVHWTPMLGHLEWYRGRVQSVRLAERDVRPHRINDPHWVREALQSGGPIEVRFTGGPSVPGLASLFNLSDERLREVMLLGPDRDDLVFRLRTRSVVLRLDQPDLRLPGGWVADSGDAGVVRAWAPNRGVWCLSNGLTSRCDGFTVGVGWSLLHYAGTLPAWLRTALSAAWVAVAVLPVGLFLRRGLPSYVATIAVASVMGILPPVVGLRLTPASEWLGAGLGLVVGSLAAVALRRSRQAGSAAVREEGAQQNGG